MTILAQRPSARQAGTIWTARTNKGGLQKMSKLVDPRRSSLERGDTSAVSPQERWAATRGRTVFEDGHAVAFHNRLRGIPPEQTCSTG